MVFSNVRTTKGSGRACLRGLLLISIFSAAICSPSQAAGPGFLRSWGGSGTGDGQFGGQVALSAGAAGDVFALDRANNRVEEFDADGVFLRTWGTFGTADGQLNSPVDISTTQSGETFVLDGGNDRVQVFNASGTMLRKWSGLNGGTAIAVDDQATDVYTANGSGIIVRWAPDGTFLGQWGSIGSGPGQFASITGLALDGAGNVYALDPQIGRVQKFSAAGAYVGEFPVVDGISRNYTGLAVDAHNNVWVVDAFAGRLREFAPNGVLVAAFQSCGGGYSGGVTVGAGGSIYAQLGNLIVAIGDGGTAADPRCAVTGPGGSTPPISPGGTTPPATTGLTFSGAEGVTVESGARYTNRRNVTLKVVAPQGAVALRISNDGGFDDAKTVPISASRRYAWTLASSGPERLPKTVYVRFSAAATQSAQSFTDDIILDETRPTILSTSVASRGAQATAASSRPRSFSVLVRARDRTSGVSQLQVAATKRRPAHPRAYHQRVVVTSIKRPRYVRVRDRAGNWSSWETLRYRSRRL